MGARMRGPRVAVASVPCASDKAGIIVRALGTLTDIGLTGNRVVVVSPHSDDGVLSLGAAMARWGREGARVDLLTVFACDPQSVAPTRGWDRRAGFHTEGEAARGRREEDRRACAILGATPLWLTFGSVDYERHGDESAVRDAVAAHVEDAAALLLPGFPLSHPDHVWLTRVLVEGLPLRCLGLYAEQPYAARSDRLRPEAPVWLADKLGTDVSFTRVPASTRDRLAKWRAIRRYRSQLPLLALSRRTRTLVWSEARAGGEAVAWVGDHGGPRPSLRGR